MSHASHQPHVTNYKILSDHTADRLSAQVESAIHNGWQPWGPLNVNGGAGDTDPAAVVFCQAIVRQAEWYR